MDIPTCKTCPYFFDNRTGRPHTKGKMEEIAQFPDPDNWWAECHRYPPAMLEKNTYENPNELGVWPEVLITDSCGEHPDFPAYLASLKAQSPNISSS